MGGAGLSIDSRGGWMEGSPSFLSDVRELDAWSKDLPPSSYSDPDDGRESMPECIVIRLSPLNGLSVWKGWRILLRKGRNTWKGLDEPKGRAMNESTGLPSPISGGGGWELIKLSKLLGDGLSGVKGSMVTSSVNDGILSCSVKRKKRKWSLSNSQTFKLSNDNPFSSTYLSLGSMHNMYYKDSNYHQKVKNFRVACVGVDMKKVIDSVERDMKEVAENLDDNVHFEP